jgi:C-terminal processing protease CtpA/Prc
VLNGELLLQLFTDTRIEPAKLHFITSPLMKRLVNGVPQAFGKWAPSMNRAVTTGATYSQMLPLEDPELYNTVGRRYPGKAVLLTNAACYSTTDIFAAGWQDHAIGPILGTDANTGAGGANVLEWPRLKELFDLFDPSEPVKQLPRGASYTVAIRATTRVRANAGVPLEDLGVEPDYIHRLTLEDLIGSGDDGPLFDKAGELTK